MHDAAGNRHTVLSVICLGTLFHPKLVWMKLWEDLLTTWMVIDLDQYHSQQQQAAEIDLDPLTKKQATSWCHLKNLTILNFDEGDSLMLSGSTKVPCFSWETHSQEETTSWSRARDQLQCQETSLVKCQWCNSTAISCLFFLPGAGRGSSWAPVAVYTPESLGSSEPRDKMFVSTCYGRFFFWKQASFVHAI